MSNFEKEKRIAILVTNDLLTDRRVNRVVSFLSQKSFEITVIGRRLQAEYPDNWPKGVTVKRFRLLFNKGPLFYFCYNLRAFFHLLFNEYELVLANDLDTLPAAYLAKRPSQRLVYDSHELFTEVPELIHRPKTRSVWLMLEKMMFPKLTHNYTVSQPIADYYQQKYGVSFQVIRNLPERKAYETAVSNQKLTELSHGKFIILYQGALNIGRGLEQMINAMPLLKDKAVFVLLGGGDIEEKLKTQVRHLHLSDVVFFLGRIPADELPSYTVQADLGISLEQPGFGLSYHYALPNKLFDYIHAKLPVLVSDLPEMKKIVEQYGVGNVITDFSPQSIAQTVTDMMQNHLQLAEWKKNTVTAANELNWENEQLKLNPFFT